MVNYAKSHFSYLFFFLLSFSLCSFSLASEIAGRSQTVPYPADTSVSLISKYIELSSAEGEKRGALFQSYSPTDKSRLVLLHLALQLASKPHLNNDQRSLILEAILITGSGNYDPEKPEQIANARRHSIAVERRAKTIFPMNEAIAIFANIGSGNDILSRLKSYRLLGQLNPLCERVSSYVSLSPQSKNDLWKTHFAVSLAVDESFTQNQKTFIVELIDLVDLPVFEEGHDFQLRSKINEKLSSISARAIELFGNSSAARLLASLGPGSSLDGYEETEGGDCGCSTSSNWCAGECSSLLPCTRKNGCGTLWLYECNGKCLFS